MKVAASADQGMMSIFSPCNSLTTACTREPRMPTQAPTGSIEEFVGDDGDLGARAGIAGDRLDFDDAVVNLRHFLREQLGGELRMRAREEDLRSARLAPHVVDIGADAVAGAEHFARDQFVAPHDRLARAGAAEIDDDIAVFDAFDLAVDDLADAVLVDVILLVALGLADFLHEHLLGGLGAECGRNRTAAAIRRSSRRSARTGSSSAHRRA